MKYTSLDKITRSVLQQRQLPIHYFLQYLKHATDCFRELNFDTLRVVNARLLPVTDYNAVELPCDFVDFVKVGIPVGQVVKPLHQQQGLSRLNNLDAQGQKIPYDLLPFTGLDHSRLEVVQNDYGEGLGRMYSFTDYALGDTFKYLPERNQLQLNQAISIENIVLEYISNGEYADAATKVDTQAQACIEAYMKWKVSPNADNPRSPEAVLYYGAWRMLRARKNNLTLEDIKRILRANTKPTIK